MNSPNLGYRMGTGVQAGAVYDEGLRKHMLRVYNYMGLGLVVTGLVAFFVASTPALYVPIFSSPLKWVVMLVEVKTRNTEARERPMTAQKAQNIACALAADMVCILNEKIMTKASGASITTHFSGLEKIGT